MKTKNNIDDRFLFLLLVYKSVKDYSNRQLSAKLDVNYSTINRWISGDSHIPPRQGERLSTYIKKELGNLEFLVIPGWLSSNSEWAIINILAGDYKRALEHNEVVFYGPHAREITFRDIVECLRQQNVLATPSEDVPQLPGKEKPAK